MQGGTETILLVDDEAIIRNLGRTILQRYGYRVLLAEDGLEALQVYRQHGEPIDLVILDLVMPRLSGHDTLRQLQQLDPDVRVLFSSGYSAEQVTETDPGRRARFRAQALSSAGAGPEGSRHSGRDPPAAADGVV